MPGQAPTSDPGFRKECTHFQLSRDGHRLKDGDYLRLSSGFYQVCGNLLGEGICGAVYRIRNEEGRDLAIKIGREMDKAPASEAFRLFKNEYYIASRLTIPSLCRAYHRGFLEPGHPYIIMPFLPGEFQPDDYFGEWNHTHKVIIDILKALAALHQEGFIHCDVSPRNIRKDSEGQICLIDFSAAVPIGKSSVYASPVYAAPQRLEQQYRRPASPDDDIFSVMVLAYLLLSGGRYPFGKPNLKKVSRYLSRIRDGKFEPLLETLGVNAKWQTVLSRGLSYDPADRFPDADDVLRALMDAKGQLRLQIGDRTIVLAGDRSATLGRDPQEVDIPIYGDQGVSALHATLLPLSDGAWLLRDGTQTEQGWKPSTNGTRVNGIPLPPDGKKLLSGDLIGVGKDVHIDVLLLK